MAIYVCPICGDLECGAITARIEREADEIVWRDFALSYPDFEAGRWHHDTAAFTGIRTLRFVAREYRSAITSRPASPGPPRR